MSISLATLIPAPVLETFHAALEVMHIIERSSYEQMAEQTAFPIRILKGDKFVDDQGEIEVLATGDSPYPFCPRDWKDYGNGGTWLYIYDADAGATDWVPEAALIRALVTERFAVTA